MQQTTQLEEVLEKPLIPSFVARVEPQNPGRLLTSSHLLIDLFFWIDSRIGLICLYDRIRPTHPPAVLSNRVAPRTTTAQQRTPKPPRHMNDTKIGGTSAPELLQGEERQQRPFDVNDENYTPSMWTADFERLRQELGADAFPDPLHYLARSGRADILKFMLAAGGDVDTLDDDGCTLLHDAVLMRRTAVVQALLSTGADVRLRCHKNDVSALDRAVCTGHVEITKTLLEHGADTNASGANGDTPLHLAAASGKSEVIPLLCLKGAHVNISNRLGRMPLHLAAVQGHLAATQALLAAGADISARNEADGMSALDHAVGGGHVEVATAIMEHGADVNAPGAHKGRTLLHIAAIFGKAEMVSRLCLRGAHVNALSSGGTTPLHEAASAGHMAVVQALLASGADVNLRGNGSMSALDLAVGMGIVDIARVIIEHGVGVNAAGTGGRNPLHHAAAGTNAEMVRFLLSKGAEIDKVDGLQYTPLNIAVRDGHIAVVQAVLAGGPDVTVRCHHGFSSLDWAVIKGNMPSLLAIMGYRADVKASGSSGLTTLHVAALHNRAEAIHVLLAAGAEIERQSITGNTPLHFAAKTGSLEAALALLKHGACVNKQSESGETPLHGASAAVGKGGTAEVVDLLLRRGANEKATTSDGLVAADMIRSPVGARDRVARDIERARKLLANAPGDRAWRRRGFLVMCRARYADARVQVGRGGDEANACVARRTRSHAEPARRARGWTLVAKMLIGVGADPISLMGNGADLIFETIVGYI